MVLYCVLLFYPGILLLHCVFKVVVTLRNEAVANQMCLRWYCIVWWSNIMIFLLYSVEEMFTFFARSWWEQSIERTKKNKHTQKNPFLCRGESEQVASV